MPTLDNCVPFFFRMVTIQFTAMDTWIGAIWGGNRVSNHIDELVVVWRCEIAVTGRDIIGCHRRSKTNSVLEDYVSEKDDMGAANDIPRGVTVAPRLTVASRLTMS